MDVNRWGVLEYDKKCPCRKIENISMATYSQFFGNFSKKDPDQQHDPNRYDNL